MAEHVSHHKDEQPNELTNLLKEKKLPKKRDDKDVIIVLAGKPGSGKSTLYHKLLEEDIQVQMAARPITKVSDSKSIENNGISVTVIDTPGIIANKAVNSAESKFHLLVLCISVSPSSKFIDSNPEIMKSLQSMYGQNVWKNCVIVFTFSNLSWDRCIKQECIVGKSQCLIDYKALIDDYASECEKELVKLGHPNMQVQSIFKRQDPGCFPDENVILAIPAGDEMNDNVLPGVPLHEGSKGWKDEIFFEMIKKCKCREDLVIFRYGYHLKNKVLKIVGVVAGSAAGASLIGAGVGAGIGAGIGLAGGPIAASVGAGAGGLIGLVAGSLTSGSGIGAYAAIQKCRNSSQGQDCS